MTAILLATDGSEAAALASRAASDLSQKTGARLHVVHAWRTPAMIEPAPVPVGPYEEDARRILDAELERAALGPVLVYATPPGAGASELHARTGEGAKR